MPTTVDDIATKTDTLEIEPKTGVSLKSTMEEEIGNKIEVEKPKPESENRIEAAEKGKAYSDQVGLEKGSTIEATKEEVPVEIEPKTGVSFPVRLDDGKQLKAVGLRKKSFLGVGIKIYGFGIYADNEKLKDLMMSKTGKAPSKPTKEMYQMVIDSDVGMMVRLVIVFSGLSMSMVRKNFDEGIGGAIKKLTGEKNEELIKKIMGEASDDIKLTPRSVIEISRLPEYTLQMKVKGEVISTIESELLCRAFIYMYLGDDPFDKEAKEKFGASLLSLL